MKLIFERSSAGRGTSYLPACDVPSVTPNTELREIALHLPEVPETEIDRHYTELSHQVYGVNTGFYPLGSCTMKYNPMINEAAASLPGFAEIHPLAGDENTQGALEVMKLLEDSLKEITGMDAVTLQPAAGAHGEFTGLLLIKAWHKARGNDKRTKIIVPDSAHGTNPASAAMAGFEVVSIPSDENGCVDIDALKAAVGEDTAGLMLTNPNTVGIFDKNITEITKIIHDAGGVNYYDGANLNAVMGVARPGDMGFDVVHVNLHKTFSTPHGGGGPGSGPVGCKEFLKEFLPGIQAECTEDGTAFRSVREEHSIGDMRSFGSNFSVVVKALAYVLSLGKTGIRETSENAVLNANYLMHLLKKNYECAYDRTCMHEFVLDLAHLKEEHGISALDVAKALLDAGIHPPTMYFPLIVHEALMFEPTETETKETLEACALAMENILKEALANPEGAHAKPEHTMIRRLDEVGAARNPVIRYTFDSEEK